MTAVEQLMIALYEGGYLRGNGNEMDDILKKYKEVFKKQLEKTFDDAVQSEILHKKITAEEYYNETYGNKGSDDRTMEEIEKLPY